MLPNPLSGEQDTARGLINNSGDSLEVFMETIDQFVGFEKQ
jgi:hypothetical protein